MKFSKISLSFFLVLVLSSFFNLTAQSGSKLMIAEDDPFMLQQQPIFEGVDEFQEKLDAIRKNEGREPMGLVLCGGSARAFAHIGALKAMEENNVTPDFIVANSMGAIIGMFYAYGFSPDKIAEVVSNINLTQYFEPVIPIHGGILSVRKFRAFVNDLLGKEETDLSECPIPILILTEDLYTKRQIWHASGDFSKIMTAAFAMSAIMEPTDFNLHDEEKTPVRLIDSGAIDIAGLSIAESFSDNIVISTAFYDAVLNYNNMIVVLNRTMSIGKERQAAKDIKKYKPVIIRNDVEHFSFMSFDKAEELSSIGYESAMNVMEDIKKCPHSYNALLERRKETDAFADNSIRNVLTNAPLKQSESYFGLKVWPVFPMVDYPDYSIYGVNGISAFAFLDSSKVYLNAGLTFPFNKKSFSFDINFTWKPSSVFEFSSLASYSFAYRKFHPENFYGAATIKVRPEFFPYALKPLFLTAEYLGTNKFAPEEMLFKAGFEVEAGDSKRAYIQFKPFYFMSGSTFASLSNGLGMNLQAMLNASAFSKKAPVWSVGIADNSTCRYAFCTFDSSAPYTKVYESDYYRAKKPHVNNNLIVSNAAEAYLVNLDPGLTFAELIIVQQWKLGGFFDQLYTGNLNMSAGGFFRTQVSLIGLCNFIFEGGCGWNITDKQFFGYFEMKNRM